MQNTIYISNKNYYDDCAIFDVNVNYIYTKINEWDIHDNTDYICDST